ncbi:hypothetical protein [Lentzea albida]|uniref:Uncharacterized protein n=1 Tax=Lentzea albida TaxID=65499 RepID=A0A1H9RI97_9PSEU|nr:hypothetical protein [Lentzea albida]SER72285.1 hypothetical protein SAMN04488000_111121 [Lentzea albida]
MSATDVRPGDLDAARLVSAVVVALMAASSAAGLLVPGLYRDPPEVVAALRAYDTVSLVLATPLLIGSLVAARRGSALARPVWLGLLMYACYNYAIYAFGSAFNGLFLLHAALLPLPVVGAVLLMRDIDAAGVRDRFRQGTPVRVISAVLVLAGVGLAGTWVFQSVRFALTGTPPDETELVLLMQAVHLAYVLDLTFFAPLCVLASVLLWRRDPRGFVLATAVLVFGSLYQVNYVVALVFQLRAGIPGARGFDPAEPFVIAAFVVALLAMVLPGRRRSP